MNAEAMIALPADVGGARAVIDDRRPQPFDGPPDGSSIEQVNGGPGRARRDGRASVVAVVRREDRGSRQNIDRAGAGAGDLRRENIIARRVVEIDGQGARRRRDENHLAGGQRSRVVGRVAGHPHGNPGRVAVRLGLEGADVGGAVGRDRDVELLADLPDQGLDIGLARLALAAW